jgi:ABC-type multidrug transport system ATPase subunit
VTHEPEIGHHCKRLVMIRDGQVVEDEPVHDRLRAVEVLERMAAEREIERERKAARRAAQEAQQEQEQQQEQQEQQEQARELQEAGRP